MSLTRREAIKLGGAAIAATAVPIPAGIEAAADVLPLPAWTVGTPGERNWIVAYARTETEALAEWITANIGEPCEGCPRGSTVPTEEVCECYGEVVADRSKSFDKYHAENEVPPHALFDAGWDMDCHRCGYETNQDECGHTVDKEIVCEGCMTWADYQKADPEHFAEMLDNALWEAGFA